MWQSPAILRRPRGCLFVLEDSNALLAVFWSMARACAYGGQNKSFFFFNFIFKRYNIVLVLPNIKMNLPQVYTCSPSWTLLPPPSPDHPSGSSQFTRPKQILNTEPFAVRSEHWFGEILCTILVKKCRTLTICWSESCVVSLLINKS